MLAVVLWSVAAFVVVCLAGAVLAAAFRGADMARYLQTQRYRAMELDSEARAIHIRTARLLWQAEQAAALREQKDRHSDRRKALNDWHREYRGYP